MRSEVPGTAAARSSYRPAAKAPRRTAELLPLQSRAVRGAVDGSLPPARILRKTMSSTAGNKTAQDSMDETKADPERRSQGTSSPSLLGSYFEAGDEDQGEPLGSTHGDHGGSTSSSSASTKEPIQEVDPVTACSFSGAHQLGSTSGSTSPRPITQQEEGKILQLSSLPDPLPKTPSIGLKGTQFQAAIPLSPVPGAATADPLTSSLLDPAVDESASTEQMDDTASIGGGDGYGEPSDGMTTQEPSSMTSSESGRVWRRGVSTWTRGG